jgi:flagellar motility protein MotE (MotC chaperone)
MTNTSAASAAKPPVRSTAARKARKPAKPKRTPVVVRLAERVKGMRFRVLPVMIFVAVLLLGVRVGEMWRLATRDARLPEFPASLAEGAPKPAPAPANGAKAPAPGAPGAAPAPPPAAPAAPPAPGGASTGMAPADGELAQHYAVRRADVERRIKDVEQREALLAAAEKRIDQKLQELDKVRIDIQKLLRTGDDKQSAQLESLVKIYETMKPKEAARIFEELDMPVLLDVIQRMKEQKTAPILASMDPLKAKQVTSALVERRTMPALPQ